MAGGGSVVIIGSNSRNSNDGAQVVGGRLLVSGLGGGGGGGDVNIVAVGGVAVPSDSVPIDDGGNSITVDDGGGALTVDGTVSVGNFPAVQSVDDNGGSLTVDDGGVSLAVNDDGGSLTVDGTVTVVDGGGAITVDGTVSVGNFPASQTVDDGGGSLTVDGTVSVGNYPASQTVDDGGGSLTVDGAVTVSGTVTDNTEVTEDAVVPATPNLIPVAVERDDSLATLTEADGDWGHLRVDSKGALWVRNVSDYQKLSASTDGKPVTIVGTNFAGRTTVHDAPASGFDKIHMVARNYGTTDQVLTIYWGDLATDGVSVLIPSTDSRVISIGEVIQNSIRISMSALGANLVKITGYVERFA